MNIQSVIHPLHLAAVSGVIDFGHPDYKWAVNDSESEEDQYKD